MTDKTVSIVTDWSQSLGSGHIQRMMNLCRYLNSTGNIECYIINDKTSVEGTAELDDFIIKDLHPDTDFIIRDMRDSEPGDIATLQRKAPVLVIDDLGTGRAIADFRIDLLPNPVSGSQEFDKFIYGYNFTRSIEELDIEKPYAKDIDIAFYTGFMPDKKYVDFILSILPANSRVAVLSGRKSFLLSKYDIERFDFKYSEALLRARVVLSHFGLFLYEGFVCGAKIAAVSPSEYHNKLTDMAGASMPVLNLGLIENIDKARSADMLKNFILDADDSPVSPGMAYGKICLSLENFYSYLRSIL